MDNAEKPAAPAGQVPVTPQPISPAPQTAAGAPQSDKPELAIPDSAAIDLLKLDNLQAAPHTTHRFPAKIVIAVIVLIILVLAASAAPGLLKTKQATDTGGQNSGSAADDTSKQINTDVESCINPVNAVTSC